MNSIRNHGYGHYIMRMNVSTSVRMGVCGKVNLHCKKQLLILRNLNINFRIHIILHALIYYINQYVLLYL